MSKSQSPVNAEDLPYRPCVGVMILNRAGLVWAGRRIPDENSEYDGSPQLWQMPQGGITRAVTARRLSRNFTRDRHRTVSLLLNAQLDQLWLPPQVLYQLKGKFRGQTQRWFAFRFEGDESGLP